MGGASLDREKGGDHGRLSAGNGNQPFGRTGATLAASRPGKPGSEPVERAGLAVVRYSHKGGQAQKLAVLPEVLAGLPDGSDFERQVMLYVVCVWDVSLAALQVAVEQAKPGRGEAMVGQVAQELIAKGEAQGFAQGKAQGFAQGEAQGEAQGFAQGEAQGEARAIADSLTRLLEHRFGQLPGPVRGWISVAPATDLRRAFMAALDAESLSEVFPGLDLD